MYVCLIIFFLAFQRYEFLAYFLIIIMFVCIFQMRPKIKENVSNVVGFVFHFVLAWFHSQSSAVVVVALAV